MARRPTGFGKEFHCVRWRLPARVSMCAARPAAIILVSTVTWEVTPGPVAADVNKESRFGCPPAAPANWLEVAERQTPQSNILRRLLSWLNWVLLISGFRFCRNVAELRAQAVLYLPKLFGCDQVKQNPLTGDSWSCKAARSHPQGSRAFFLHDDVNEARLTNWRPLSSRRCASFVARPPDRPPVHSPSPMPGR